VTVFLGQSKETRGKLLRLRSSQRRGHPAFVGGSRGICLHGCFVGRFEFLGQRFELTPRRVFNRLRCWKEGKQHHQNASHWLASGIAMKRPWLIDDVLQGSGYCVEVRPGKKRATPKR